MKSMISLVKTPSWYSRLNVYAWLCLVFLFSIIPGCIPTTPLGPTDTFPHPTIKKSNPISDDPKIVLANAIKAMGGEEALKRLKINLFKGHGRMLAGQAPSDYRLRTQNALPDRIREEFQFLDAKGQPQVTIISVVNRDKGAVQYNTELKELDAAGIKSWQEVLYTNLVMTLVPLQEPRFTLVAQPQQRKEGVLCQSFTVKSKNHRDVTLFFNKETGLPILVQTTIFDPNLQLEMTQELFLRDFKDFTGLKYPTRWVVYLNGNKTQEFNIEEAQFPDKIDDQVFIKP